LKLLVQTPESTSPKVLFLYVQRSSCGNNDNANAQQVKHCIHQLTPLFFILLISCDKICFATLSSIVAFLTFSASAY